ncbi:phosphatidylglycerol lysyltransferase domain-containing protein [Rhizobium sp. SL86]|uniref:phosphatidylglycerol lysyltransferase domain-containing protein n=1 Tax=Rhizobium sp. SL86 TaxID=2995148 RepID=UPI0022765F3B|nr:phosphatidylglycerol lysyltransferase domain-containing protein [Rhizobium sp. SL86]MCY1664346.1 phosphatidylglycerol lysyltransferase domain-containing protein [Rhizobium sp. SL86]
MDTLSADRDMIVPTTLTTRSPSRIAAYLADIARHVRPGSNLFGFTSLVALAGVLFVYLFMEEALFALRLWGAPGIGETTGATLSFTLIAGAWAGRRFVGPMRRRKTAVCPVALEKAVAILNEQGNASAGLVRLGDKQILLSDAGDAFIMFGCHGQSQIALFDPVGPKEAWHDLVLKFVRDAKRQGRRPVFYQVSPQFLPIAVEAGLNPYKLGEQAIVDLKGFSLQGGEWLKLRRSINRAERDGLEFSLLSPDAVPAVLDELRGVSNAWLAAHNAAEKGFSLGTFRDAYVAAQSVAVIRMEGRIVAFASIMTAPADGDAFIDLMRHIPGTHRGMMDLLFVKIMERLKADGFRTLNMGMAPLAGLPNGDYAPLWNQIGRQVFENGERFYNFRGVLAFKSKFDPKWESRYLVVSGSGLPLGSLLDVTMLIGGGIKGILRR